MRYVNKEALNFSGERVTFSFGRNWRKYSKHIDESRVEAACHSIQEFTGLEDLRNYRFLDLGCGSGLFSLVAWRMKADLVISLDIDPFAITCTRQLWQINGCPSNWLITQGSVLDLPFNLSGLQAGFVYSWGVLHHTGAMFRAIREVTGLVRNSGFLYLAIYNANRYSRYWLSIKRFYNRSPWLIKQLMYFGFIVFSFLMLLLRESKNPIKHIKDYERTARGMSWFRDVEDWLGGLPYEYAHPDKVIDFLQPFGFSLQNCRSTTGHGNNEYLFKRL